jgi:hypothetical protein
MNGFTVVTLHHLPSLTSNILSLYELQIAGETFDIIQSNVLQGSKVILDVEEEGLDKRTVLSLDAATEISSSGSTCFQSSDGKEHCFADAEPGDCSSFADFEGRRQLGIFKKMKKGVESAASKAARLLINLLFCL